MLVKERKRGRGRVSEYQSAVWAAFAKEKEETRFRAGFLPLVTAFSLPFSRQSRLCFLLLRAVPPVWLFHAMNSNAQQLWVSHLPLGDGAQPKLLSFGLLLEQRILPPIHARVGDEREVGEGFHTCMIRLHDAHSEGATALVDEKMLLGFLSAPVGPCSSRST